MDFGRKANVKLKDMESGRPKPATTHDWRRSFGFRWSQRVFPLVLKEVMRHSLIATTEKYYATQDAR